MFCLYEVLRFVNGMGREKYIKWSLLSADSMKEMISGKGIEGQHIDVKRESTKRRHSKNYAIPILGYYPGR